MAACFIEERSTDYSDFGATAADFSSYFITGPKIRGEGQRSGNIEYITVFCNVITDGSLYMRARWDWADESSTGKWSTEQQCYTVNRDYRDVSRRRLLVRGSGPALQLQFRSQAGKPFELIGWAAAESVDGTP